jgi:hypothetical protein
LRGNFLIALSSSWRSNTNTCISISWFGWIVRLWNHLAVLIIFNLTIWRIWNNDIFIIFISFSQYSLVLLVLLLWLKLLVINTI